jgi:hypothetical protein
VESRCLAAGHRTLPTLPTSNRESPRPPLPIFCQPEKENRGAPDQLKADAAAARERATATADQFEEKVVDASSRASSQWNEVRGKWKAPVAKVRVKHALSSPARHGCGQADQA